MARAVSAQGTQFQIGAVDATPTTITGITQANPAVVSATAHGLANGDLVYIDDVGGMTEVNGKSYVVSSSTANTFEINEDTTGYTTYTTGGTAGLVTWTNIAKVQSYSRDGDRAEIDVSSLDSTAKEYILGLQDFGSWSLSLFEIDDDPGQLALKAGLDVDSSFPFQILSTGGARVLFEAFVRSFNPAGGTDAARTASATLRVTGRVRYVAAP